MVVPEPCRSRQPWPRLLTAGVVAVACAAAASLGRPAASSDALTTSPSSADPTRPTQGDTALPLTWQRISDMPAGVLSARLSVQGRQAIVTGGMNQAGATSPLVQVLDLDRFTWTTPLTLPTGMFEHTQVTLADGRVFLAGGRTGSLLDGLQKTAATWVISADLRSVQPGPPLPEAADYPTSHRLPDGRVLVIAGKRASLLDPATLTWQAHIALRESRREHGSALLPDGRVIVVGGIGRRTMEVIDPARRVSVMLAPRLPHATDDLAVVALPDGRVWLAGGQRSDTGDTLEACHVVDLSDPRRATLADAPPLGVPGGLADAAVATLGRWIFVLGGETQQANRDREQTVARIIDAHTLAVWSLPDLTVAHDEALAVADGRGVILLGGFNLGTLTIGPLRTGVPMAVHLVERLTLPAHRLDQAGPPTP